MGHHHSLLQRCWTISWGLYDVVNEEMQDLESKDGCTSIFNDLDSSGIWWIQRHVENSFSGGVGRDDYQYLYFHDPVHPLSSPSFLRPGAWTIFPFPSHPRIQRSHPSPPLPLCYHSFTFCELYTNMMHEMEIDRKIV